MAKRRLPILIIPGFMSSGLQVEESRDRPEWKNKRIWLNLRSLGFSALHSKGATADSDSDDDEESPHQAVYKSHWMNHMALVNGTEREGVRVRPLSGLTAIDYLTPGMLTNHVSYVFGPLIRTLQSAGYDDDDLQTAPYDWRLAPGDLEQRDGYFTKTMQQVCLLQKMVVKFQSASHNNLFSLDGSYGPHKQATRCFALPFTRFQSGSLSAEFPAPTKGSRLDGRTCAYLHARGGSAFGCPQGVAFRLDG